MRNVFLGAAIVLSAAALNSQYVSAAPLDEAKAALAQKQYDKVDTILAAELAQKVPSPDALRISMDAAVASGRIVTAGSRVTALLKLSGEKDPELLFRGGQIAQLNGDAHNALIRFLAYARQASAKTDQADEAFRYILRSDAYPDQYKQYVKLFGADARSWSLGLIQFQKLVDALNGDQALDLAGFLMTTFPNPENVDAIDSALYTAANANIFGREKDHDVKPLRVMAMGEPSNFGAMDPVFQQSTGAFNEETGTRFLLDLMARYKRPLSLTMLQQLSSWARAIKNDDTRVAAGREFLSHEAAYLAAPDKESYYWFFRQIGESPSIFAVKDKGLLAPAALAEKVDAIKAKSPENFGRMQECIQWVSTNYLAGAPDARAAFLGKYLVYLNHDQVGDYVSLSKANWNQTLVQWGQGKTFTDVLGVRVQQAHFYNDAKDKAGLAATAHDYLAVNTGNFAQDQFRNNFINSPIAEVPEKLAWLKEAIDKGGYSNPMRDLLNGMAQDAAWNKNPQFIQLKADFDKKPVGSDPIMRTLVALATIPANRANPDKNALDAGAKFLAEYKGPIPAGDEDPRTLETCQVEQVTSLYVNHIWDNPTAVTSFADNWLPRTAIGGTTWPAVINRVHEHHGEAEFAKLMPIYAKAVRADKTKNDPAVWTSFATIGAAPGAPVSPFAEYLDLVPTDVVSSWLWNQRETWNQKHQFITDEIARAAATPGAKYKDVGLINQLFQHINAWAGEPNYKIPVPLVATLWRDYLEATDKSGADDPNVDAIAYEQFLRAGPDGAAPAGAFFKDWSARVAKRPLNDQLYAYAELFRFAGHLPSEPAGTPPTPGFRHYIIFNTLKPLYEQVPQRLREQITVSGTVIGEVTQAANAAPPPDPKTDPKIDPKTYPQVLAEYKTYHEAAVGYCRTLAEMLADGARTDVPPNYIYGLSSVLVGDALAKNDPTALVRALWMHAGFSAPATNWDQIWTSDIPPLLKALDDRKADEPTYAFLTKLQNEAHLPEAVAKALLLVKAKAGTQIPGIIPVGPDDPSYDLYLAAHDLSIGDEQHAWELTGPRLKLLVQTWPAMDPSYVAWSVEQLRKQKLLKDGLEFSFNILLHEADIDADNAARVLLAKGDIYRDMENYQAARIEYEGLKGNNRYNKTDAGGKAVYRLVDLYILTKDYSAAESLLEHLVDADNVQQQADAYYLYAKMSFQKGDFKESRDYLKKVKERVSNHVEAALLEGELNLVLPGGLQNTEVAIGDSRLSTVVIPGRQLTLTLQDPNLSIARGGAAIPVVITTSKGGDVEHVKLLPSSANKNLFSARIATALGKAQKDNLTLELKGDDVVSYEIEPEFQKANDLKYPPKKLDVRYDARLVASSGEILTEEEEEKRELERQLEMRQAGTTKRYEVNRDGRTIRPGSKIFIQVTDFCRDVTDEPDKIKVDLKTGLGDTLEGVELTETGPHTGVFRGGVPTGVPDPRAYASDTDAGHLPASVIADGSADSWSSLADGKKGKWLEVDTMSSHELSTVVAKVPNLDQVKDISFLGMLSDDYEELATFPARADAAKGGLMLDTAPDQGGETADQIHRFLKLSTNASVWTDSPAFDRAVTAGKDHDGWQTNRLKGVFYLPANQTLELKWLSAPPPQDWLRCHILIDGQEVLDGHNSTTIDRIRHIELAKGAHTYDLLVRDNWAQSKLILGYKTDAGTYAPIPAEWFSVKAHPELLEILKPKGVITGSGDLLTLKLNQPRRLRKLRLMFNDFVGTGVSVKSVAITDADRKQVVPLKKNAAAGLANSVLQISPGDTITVSYDDHNRLHEDSKVLISELNSSYFNGKIALAEEIIRGEGEQRRTEYLDAKRVRVGDQLSVIVTDYDEDTTEGRDTVPVTVKTSSGEKLVINALETWINGSEDQSNHAGEFIAILKIGDKTEKNTIKVQSGDRITVSYLDKENTDPGIPIERSYSINEAGAGKPDVLAYRTRVRMTVDDSPEAHARLKRLAGKEVKGAVLYKPQVIARDPEYVAVGQPATRPSPEGQIIAAVNAPLLFEVKYPERVLNSGSVLEVTAVADSELKAAASAKREPTVLKVPTYVEGVERLAQIKGYPIQLESASHRDAKDMLRDGAFAGVIRLQIGGPGDPIDDMVTGGEREFARETTAAPDDQSYWYKVPTLLVSGSDIVHLRIKDDSGAVSETNIRLLSDAILELMDPTYTIENDAIHLGEKFHIKLTDPDHDISNERDTVKVRVRSTSGGDITLVLNETLPHSGVFTGMLQPEFVGDPKAGSKPTTQPGGEKLYVSFGDDVTFEYVDDLSLESTSPVTVLKKGKILFGADAEIAVFTKRFKDPEIAVKTRFLMAESLFEMAKEHRKLTEVARADEEIAHGKTILEEAIRDYPNTSLAAQGDYLLANLAQELTNYQEAVGRYSNVISTWPDSEYASQSQFKKAICFEKLENYDQAVEEYVKLTYIYPESALVPDATVRLGNYYYKKQSYKVAAKIFYNFQQKNPSHKLAAEALFLSAQCDYKLADYHESGRLFQKVVDEYPDEKNVRPEAMYWLADSNVKSGDNVKAYQSFKRVTWDYPESEWAKRARGRLTEDAFSHMQDEQ